MVQGYNTFLGQDYCPVAPDRLIATGVIPVSGLDDAIAELKRCRELGLRTVALTQFPNGSRVSKPEDDRFWEAALSVGMPVSAHVYFGVRYQPLLTGSPVPNAHPQVGLLTHRVYDTPTYTMIQLIASGVFERFPDLRIYFAETDGHWLPGALGNMDDNYERNRHLFTTDIHMPPSEYVRRHFFFGLVRDAVALQMRDLLPAENLMWGSDLPHQVGTYPDSRAWLERIFEGVPPGLKQRIVVDNPARFLGLDLETPLTETPNGVHGDGIRERGLHIRGHRGLLQASFQVAFPRGRGRGRRCRR